MTNGRTATSGSTASPICPRRSRRRGCCPGPAPRRSTRWPTVSPTRVDLRIRRGRAGDGGGRRASWFATTATERATWCCRRSTSIAMAIVHMRAVDTYACFDEPKPPSRRRGLARFRPTATRTATLTHARADLRRGGLLRGERNETNGTRLSLVDHAVRRRRPGASIDRRGTRSAIGPSIASSAIGYDDEGHQLLRDRDDAATTARSTRSTEYTLDEHGRRWSRRESR